MFFIVMFLCLVQFISSLDEECPPGVTTRIAGCNQLWGYNEDVIYREQRVYERTLFNISQLLTFCRTSHRADIGECQREAVVGCDPGFGAQGAVIWDKMTHLLGDGVNYLCSQQSVLERDVSCLDRISSLTIRCAQVAWGSFVEELRKLDSSSPVITAMKQLMEKLGRDGEQCIAKVIKERCNSELADVFGNFLYGSAVYPFDEENQNGR
ncbi:uncharacterized protein LOC135475567 [Liolophura sinensis]|uniref:uncharacterized protein LOC135475567 n=1 Tax=Liolophura sinensis TaxID=3198878 RepID=UPI0031585606